MHDHRRMSRLMGILCLSWISLACGPVPTVTVLPDVAYGHKCGFALTFDVYRPLHPTGGAVLFVNSGGYVSGTLSQYETPVWGQHRFLDSGELRLPGDPTPLPLLDQFSFAGLLDAGFTVFDVRHGGGTDYRLPDIVDDLRRALRFVQSHAKDFEIDPDRLGVWGASSGGHLALLLALTGDGGDPDMSPRLQAVATYYPAGFDLASDVERFPVLLEEVPALRVSSVVLDSLSLRHHVSPDDPPALLIYGADDYPFIVAPCESLYVRLTQSQVDCRRVVLPGTGHEFCGQDGYHAAYGERARKEVVDWFRSTLLTPPLDR